MRYKTATAFRRAVEERLRQQSFGGQPLARLRKMIAFDRFLTRLGEKEPKAWIVKGGFVADLVREFLDAPAHAALPASS